MGFGRRGRISDRERRERIIGSHRAIAAGIQDPVKRAEYEERFVKELPPKRHRVVRPVDGKPAAPLEKEIQKAILEALRLRRDVVFVGRFNRGQAVAHDAFGNTRYTAFNTVKGFPDIHGMLVGGRAFWIEVKRPGGAKSDDQEQFLTNVRINGGLAGVATSVEEAMAILAVAA